MKLVKNKQTKQQTNKQSNKQSNKQTNTKKHVAIGKILYQSALSQLVTEVYTAEWKTFEGENFHKLVENTIFARKLLQIACFCAPNQTPLSKFTKVSPSKISCWTIFAFVHAYIIILSYLLYSEKLLEWTTVVSTVEVEELS